MESKWINYLSKVSFFFKSLHEKYFKTFQNYKIFQTDWRNKPNEQNLTNLLIYKNIAANPSRIPWPFIVRQLLICGLMTKTGY